MSGGHDRTMSGGEEREVVKKKKKNRKIYSSRTVRLGLKQTSCAVGLPLANRYASPKLSVVCGKATFDSGSGWSEITVQYHHRQRPLFNGNRWSEVGSEDHYSTSPQSRMPPHHP